MAGLKKRSSPAAPGGRAPVAEAEPAASTLRERVLSVAAALVGAEGLASLKVRDVAAAAGCSVGSIYNAYADIDDLVIAVNRRTLLRLDAWLERATWGVPRERILQALAAGYLDFATAETRSLRALFEHRMTDARPFPEDHLHLVEATFSRIAAPLANLLPETPPAEVAVLARTLFSAVHGIIILGLEERIVAVLPVDLRSQVALFVEVFEAGLAVRRTPPEASRRSR